MNKILSQPLASFLGIKESESPDKLLELEYTPNLSNHFNSFHASAIFSLADYSSGAFLVRYFTAYRYNTLPIIRRAQIKYSHKPEPGKLVSSGFLTKTTVEEVAEQLETKRRVLFEIQISIHDSLGNLVFKGNFEWFVTKKP